MNNNENIILLQQRIQDFLLGKLTAKEKQQFEQNMQQDPFLQKEVQLFQEINFVLKESSLVETSQHIWKDIQEHPITPDFELEMFEKNIILKNNWWNDWKNWLIGVGLLLTLTGFFFLQSQQTIQEQLAVNYLTHFENVINTGEKVQSTLVEAMSAYNRKEYKQAIPLFKTYLAQGYNREIALYQGVAYLHERNALQAISILAPLAYADEEIFAATAQWYLSLAYLYNNRGEEALPLLKNLQSDEIWGNQAKTLVNELESILE